MTFYVADSGCCPHCRGLRREGEIPEGTGSVAICATCEQVSVFVRDGSGNLIMCKPTRQEMRGIFADGRYREITALLAARQRGRP